MNCKKALNLLPLFVSDDLSAAELKEVESHMGTCLTCFRAYQEQLKAHRALKLLGERPDLSRVLEGFHGAVMKQVSKQGPAAPVPRLVYPTVRRYAAAAAIIALAFTAFYFLGPSRRGAGSVEPGSAGVAVPVNPVGVHGPLSPPFPEAPKVRVQPKERSGPSPMRPLDDEEARRRWERLRPLDMPQVMPAGERRDF